MNLKLLRDFIGREITVNYAENTAHLNKWSLKGCIELDRKCIQELIKLKILEEDSGCIETSEVHFIFNVKNFIKNKSVIPNLDPLLKNLRDYRIDRILKD